MLALDHSKGPSVKCINLLQKVYKGRSVVRVAFEVVRKLCPFSEVNTHSDKQAAEFIKNELM